MILVNLMINKLAGKYVHSLVRMEMGKTKGQKLFLSAKSSQHKFKLGVFKITAKGNKVQAKNKSGDSNYWFKAVYDLRAIRQR